MTDLKSLEKDIKRTKANLIHKVAMKGIYENFGQKECRALEDKYNAQVLSYEDYWKGRQMINKLLEWCEIYNG
jgi:hypothetical protein